MTNNIEVQISYDTSRPARDARAYRVSYGETDDPCHDLRQIGEVRNNVVYYRAVYATHQAAQAAADDYTVATFLPGTNR